MAASTDIVAKAPLRAVLRTEPQNWSTVTPVTPQGPLLPILSQSAVHAVPSMDDAAMVTSERAKELVSEQAVY